jgi:hypothetical protein
MEKDLLLIKEKLNSIKQMPESELKDLLMSHWMTEAFFEFTFSSGKVQNIKTDGTGQQNMYTSVQLK